MEVQNDQKQSVSNAFQYVGLLSHPFGVGHLGILAVQSTSAVPKSAQNFKSQVQKYGLYPFQPRKTGIISLKRIDKGQFYSKWGGVVAD